VLCAGQEPLRELQAPLAAAGVAVHLIGGADEAGELDAKRAIDQGTRLGRAALTGLNCAAAGPLRSLRRRRHRAVQDARHLLLRELGTEEVDEQPHAQRQVLARWKRQ